MKLIAILGILLLGISMSFSRPQKKNNNKMPMPYEFNWSVKDPEAEKNGAFFQQTESKKEDTPDRVEGEYKVLFDDGRLMTVTYYVDGESGFVPTITWEDNFVPDFKR